ncbi:MAG: flagellar hook-length control protein FliK [Betaproteobacteria bacterium]|nr:MAG: flagellar hook-length control protein FliK [Betaproteobacteria bacterium]
MIPSSDLVNLTRLRPATEAGTPQVTPAQGVSDLLSELAPGQRIMAEIQAILPNGTYRALIAQREVTLALPFSAKSGDSLEMEVVENNGRTALAVVARSVPQEGATESSAATSLSRTGQLIATLLTDAPDSPKDRATPLNGNHPLATSEKLTGEQLAPLLKQAVRSSGLFYEAHQARWASGQFNLAELMKEPQAQASPALLQGGAPAPQGATATVPQPLPTSSAQTPQAGSPAPTVAKVMDEATVTQAAPHPSSPPQSQNLSVSTSLSPDLAPLIRQQLESLASNTYVWHGQVWPGQEMQWELVEEDGRQNRNTDDGEPASTWNTQLRLNLPHLGQIVARLGLADQQVTLHLAAASPQTREQLMGNGQQLASQFEAAGLTLGGFMVDKNEPDTTP